MGLCEDSRPVKASSWAWKALKGVKSLLAKGTSRMVGNGDSILVWDDPWIPSTPSYSLCPQSVFSDGIYPLYDCVWAD